METNSHFRKFLLLWTGELISSIGGGLTSFGLGVYVFRMTGSAAGMALVTLLAFLPTLLLSAPAGVLADRYDRRLLMMLGDGLSAIGIVYILICMLNGGASLAEICIGVTISSVFSSLLEPAYRATVTDLLSAEEYSRANGLVSLAGSARYLIAPLLAGLLLSVADIELLLIIDACTFFITVAATGIVRKGLTPKPVQNKESFMTSFKLGWKAITARKGVLLLIMGSAVITFLMGVFQILGEPLILSFADSKTLGISETICASGMGVSGILLGIKGIKKGYVKTLIISLVLAGLGMLGFGLKENMILLCITGFFFFAMLPLANSCLDYLLRTNIADEFQGRAWGLVGFLSQMGYVVAYAISGLLADGLGELFDIGVGRGAAVVISSSGILLIIAALIIIPVKSIRNLEHSADSQEKKQEE